MALRYYNQALEKGIAKESAAFLLPMSANTKLYMQGTIRSWIHYCNLRTHEGTQLEHRNIALEIKNQLSELLPNVAKALGWIDES
jgi:thymidylate synthase (FAD)